MNPVTGLSLGRVAIGTAALAAPDVAARLAGMDPVANPQLSYVFRLFGSREVALGALTLLASGSNRRNLALVGMAVDAADAVTGYVGVTSKQVPSAAGSALVVVAVGAVIGGLAGLRVRKTLVTV